MKKHLLTTFLFVFLSLHCKSQTRIQLIDKHSNTFSYKCKFDISLPKGYYFLNSIFYNKDSLKIGEVILDQLRLNRLIKGSDFIRLTRDGGKIYTDVIDFEFDCVDCEFIKSDSVALGEHIWYYVIAKSEYEGGDEYGLWNTFKFCTINGGKILLITFFNKNLSDISTVKYETILKSIKLK